MRRDELEVALIAAGRREDSGKTVTAAWLRARFPRCWREAWRHLRLQRELKVVLRPEPGRLGPYRLIEELGRGGMGVVFRAEVAEAGAARPLGEEVALKVIRPRGAGARDAFARFVTEVALGRQIVHPNVVATYEPIEDMYGRRRCFAYSMEFVRGSTLAQVIREYAPLSEALCRHIGCEIAKGLGAIHAVGAVHRDLKPANVMLTTDEVVKVMDLGIALVGPNSSRRTLPGVRVATPAYAAPEQLAVRARIDARADVYALGIVLYELATGVHPFLMHVGRGAAKDRGAPRYRPMSSRNPLVSPFLEAVVRTLLRADPRARFADAAAVAEVLERGEKSAWWTARSANGDGVAKNAPVCLRKQRETSFEGRAPALADLQARLRRAADGEGDAVLVTGEPGIGRSRLVEEFAALVSVEHPNVHVLSGVFPPGGATSAGQVYASVFRTCETADRSRTRTSERPAGGPQKGDVRALAVAGGVDHAGTASGAGHPIVRRALASLGVRRTVVVLIDDLHLASDEGRAVFAELASAARGRRVLVIGTLRTSGPDRWALDLEQAGLVTVTELRRLSPAEVKRSLAETLGHGLSLQEVAPRIVRLSDGNPRHVVELLQLLCTDGYLHRAAGGRWTVTRPLSELPVPRGIGALLHLRLSVLTPDDRAVLDCASCAGFRFDARLIAGAMDRKPLQLLQVLDRIAREQRLIRPDGPEYAFDSEVLQTTLVGALSPGLRQEYHLRLLRCLESASGAAARAVEDLEPDTCVKLLLHAVEAQSAGTSAKYLGRGMQILMSRCQYALAADVAMRISNVAPGAVDADSRTMALLVRIDCLQILGRVDEASAACDQLAASGVEYGPMLAEVLRARLRSEVGTVDDGLQFLRVGAEAARDVGGPALTAMLVAEAAHTCVRAGCFAEATELLARAAECADTPELRARVLAQQAGVDLVAGRREDAIRRVDEAARLASEVGATALTMRIQGLRAQLIELDGRHDEARALLHEVREWASGDGVWAELLVADLRLAALECRAGSPDRAIEHADRAVAVARAHAGATHTVGALLTLSAVCRELGRSDDAVTAASEASRIARDAGARHHVYLAMRELASSHRSGNRMDLAISTLIRAAALGRQAGLPDSADAMRELIDAITARGGVGAGSHDAPDDGAPYGPTELAVWHEAVMCPGAAGRGHDETAARAGGDGSAESAPLAPVSHGVAAPPASREGRRKSGATPRAGRSRVRAHGRGAGVR